MSSTFNFRLKDFTFAEYVLYYNILGETRLPTPPQLTLQPHPPTSPTAPYNALFNTFYLNGSPASLKGYKRELNYLKNCNNTVQVFKTAGFGVESD